MLWPVSGCRTLLQHQAPGRQLRASRPAEPDCAFAYHAIFTPQCPAICVSAAHEPQRSGCTCIRSRPASCVAACAVEHADCP